MTEEKQIEEILYESHSVNMKREVMDKALEIMGTDPQIRRIDAYQQAYTDLVEDNL